MTGQELLFAIAAWLVLVGIYTSARDAFREHLRKTSTHSTTRSIR